MVAQMPEQGAGEVAETAMLVEDVFVNPAAEPLPEDGAAYDERIELVRSGLVRIWINGVRYRLRRPFFGEFRDIRLALQDANEEVANASDDSLAVSRQMTIEAKTAEDMDPEQWAAWRRDARKRSNETARELIATTDRTRLEWWTTAWNLLTLDESPPDWPPWVTDAALHAALIAHWRSSPLGRG